ncbi:amino acid transporter [Lepidopterella palustris CBS 459.81]|uniref:Amino acid transporter n=1 Tax=Lepidopterella palustris CBS 459.81 TaxID=1314670 RepID=A0A8E2JEC2_9PEZI|nr:amino acid transporter [Lepidopterella palustris CBS 459.81]
MSEEFLLSQGEGEQHSSALEASGQVPRSLTFVNGLAIVLGLSIGSGIFSAPAAVRSDVSSTGLAMLVWVVGGIINVAGAASFATLGRLVPLNGGFQEYLRLIYGNLFGFLAAWIWIFVSRPLAMAMVSLIFSEYLFRAILTGQTVSMWIVKPIAILAVAAITLINCLGTRMGTGAANVFLVIKVLGLSSIAVVGIAVYASNANLANGSGPLNVGGGSNESPEISTSINGFVDAILAAAFAYGGWESLGFIAGEIKEAETTIPKILKAAMTFIIVVFLSANFALYATLPEELLKQTNAPALDFGLKIFGRPGALFYTWIVCTCSLGSLNSVVLSTSRFTQAAGARQYLPPFLGTYKNATEQGQISRSGFLVRYSPVNLLAGRQQKSDNIPRHVISNNFVFYRNAMMLNCVLATGYILIGSFRQLLTFKVGMMEYIVYFVTIFGLLVLWRRSVVTPNGIRTGSIVAPLVFCCLVGLILLQYVVRHLVEFGLILIYIALCCGLYYKAKWRRVDGPEGTAQ